MSAGLGAERREMKYSIKWYWLRWLCGIAQIVDGVAITVTFGFWWPSVGLKIESTFMNEFEKLNMPNAKVS